MNPYDHSSGSDSLRWLQMAEKLLSTRDLNGSKTFAMKARESDPNSEAADQILAIIDTLIAGDKQMGSNSNHLDWYSILQLARRTHDSELIGLQYKRLGVLLNPNRNKYPFAEHAYKLVTEAWLVLSNPSRKFQFDNEFGNSNFNFNFIQTNFETSRENVGSSSGGPGGVQFNFMQEGSEEQVNQSNSMQFVQQQQQGFVSQAIPFFSEEQEQQNEESLSGELHWSNQGKQALVRPQPQQGLLRPHLQQNWFQQPEAQSHVPHPSQRSQSRIQPQLHQPSLRAQLLPQSQSKPLPEAREQSMQPLHWAQHPPLSQPQPQSWMQQALPRPQMQQSLTEPRPQPESREQPQKPSPQLVPQPPPELRGQPQQPLHSSQPVSQLPPLSPTQPWTQQSLPRPQIQTSSPEPLSHPETTPPQSREWVNNGEQINLGEKGENHDNVNVEEPSNFWTVCAYCYSMYEYSGIYADCTLRCQNCKKAFHAVRTEAPPAVADGEGAYICCWGYFPIGVSMSYLEKRKAEASSWQPFSKMFVIPQGGNTSASPQEGIKFAFPEGVNTNKRRKPRNSGPWIYVDDDEVDIFDGISSNEESDDEDWDCARKNKKARSFTRKVSTAIKVKQPQPVAEMVQDSNTGTSHSGVGAPDGLIISVPETAIPVVPEGAVPIVPEAAVPSVPVPTAAMDITDIKVVETSKNKVSVPIRKQPGRVAKDSRKLDGVVAQEGLGASVADGAEVSFSLTNQIKDSGKLDGVDGVVAQEGSGVSVSDMTVVSVPNKKQPGRVAKDLGKPDGVDGVVTQEGLGVNVPDGAAPSVPMAEVKKIVMGEAEKKAVGGSSRKRVSVPTRKQPGRVAKDLGKLDLNVEFNNEVEGPARGTSGRGKAVNGAEENVDGVAFFEGLDEYLSSLPILSADAGDKAKAV